MSGQADLAAGMAPEEVSRHRARREARRAANWMISFLGHAVVWATTCFFLLVVAGLTPAVIVALAWGIGLSCHGFFGVLAPILRKRWVAEQGSAIVASERKEIHGRHARSLEELSASIAHEIRNPITAAKSLVQQMGEDPTSRENLEYARVALEELDRVERSVSHLLRFAREEDLEVRDMEPSEVVSSALDAVQERFEPAGVELRRRVEPCGTMRGDPEKLRRVVQNLVGNALDAVVEARPDRPFVEVSTGRNLAGTEIWWKVRDNGAGIDAEDLDRIWSPFFTTKSAGTGLGLAICRKIVEAHGGTIEVKSEPGRGTELLVVIPSARSGET